MREIHIPKNKYSTGNQIRFDKRKEVPIKSNARMKGEKKRNNDREKVN